MASFMVEKYNRVSISPIKFQAQTDVKLINLSKWKHFFSKCIYYWNQYTQNCCASTYVWVMHSHHQQCYQSLISSWSLKTT